MRCPRCFQEVPVDATHCPKCKLATPKVQQSGVSTGITGKYAPAQIKTKKLAKKPGKKGMPDTSGEGVSLARWQLVVIISGVVLVFGMLGYGISEYRFWNTPAPTSELGALHLVERARASQGGTVGEAITAYIVQLVNEKKLEEDDGWRVECQNADCEVTYTIKAIGQSPQSAVWKVNLETKAVSPQNSWAIDLTK